jgi:hypothetical protein
MCTAIPDVGVQQFALAGVDAGADLEPSVSASARNASAQRMACVGPSNVARWPSPVLFHRAAEDAAPVRR